MPSFGDLSIAFDDKNLEKKICTAARLGYDTVAITYTHKKSPPTTSTEGGKKKKPGKQSVPPPPPQPEDSSLKRLTRIQFTEVDHGILHSLPSKEIQAYDIIGVNVTDENFFKTIIKSPYIDVITLDVSERLPFYLKRTPVQFATSRGIHFEIQYGQALRDSSCKRQMVATAQELIKCCKGKPIEMRGPYDVMNLYPSQKFYIYLKRRKLTKETVKHQRMSEITPGDEWIKDKLDAHRIESQSSDDVLPAVEKVKSSLKKRKLLDMDSQIEVAQKKKKKVKNKGKQNT
ncbi:hypothetical protein FSP39_020432 [Pinctada imbricata]|uniref:Uncharacterized protein n=1 Tax=Pinctada imbricata TaxID=66713 RepID=A0AA88YQH3_PINIB|nr:hypothetical protein FSP39_020432 [Pinctada imbricata]